MKKINRMTSLGLIAAMLSLFMVPLAQAAALTLVSDTMSRTKRATLSDHTISFVTSTGVASTETIVVTFPSDFNLTADPQGALDFSDVDLFEDTSADGACATGAEGTAETLVAASPAAGQWSAVFSGGTNRVLTFTSGGATAIIAAASEVCIKIGENAVGGSANSQYNNPTLAGSYEITLTAGTSDSGSVTVDIQNDDQVAVTAAVPQTLTFSISDTAIGFGNLVTANARFANGAATGADGTAGPTGTITSAHTLSIATNAPTGYTITYNGATLTSGTDNIDVATITNDSDGTPGTEQFAIGFDSDGNASIASGYTVDAASTGTNDYTFVAGTTTSIISEAVPTATETISAYYLGNISAITVARVSYITSITYVVTANF